MKVNYKTMRIFMLLLVMLLALGTVLSGCGGAKLAAVSAPVKIAALNGPTGMGLAPLVGDERFDITLFQSPDEVVGKVLSGEVDIAAVPSNMGSILYNKTEGQVELVAVNTGGVLYLLENGTEVQSIADLKDKTIYASGKGGAPEFILQRILLDAGLSMKDMDIQWMANHSDVASSMAVNQGTVALLPEPFVTVAISKNEQFRIAADLNQIWQDTYKLDLPMGVLIASKAMVEEREGDLKAFLHEYEKAVGFVNEETELAAQKIVSVGIIADETIAEKAIPGCNIIFLGSENAKETLVKFYDILFEMEPKSLGGKLPDETFYYTY